MAGKAVLVTTQRRRDLVSLLAQLMVVSVRGPDGQRAVRLVGLVPSLEADSVITPPLMLEDKTALGTSHRRKVVSLRHVLGLSTEAGQRTPLGAHVQNPNTVFKAPRSEQEPAPILLRLMEAMTALDWQRNRKFVPHKRTDALPISRTSLTKLQLIPNPGLLPSVVQPRSSQLLDLIRTIFPLRCIQNLIL